MALIKIVKIKKIVDALIEFVRDDYNNLTKKGKNLQITGIATTDGNIIITVGGVNYNISVLTTDTIPEIIVKILAETYVGYTALESETITNSVDFINKTESTVVFDSNATGVTGIVTTKDDETFLYRLLSDNDEGDYNFYTQSLEIFLRDDLIPRKIQTSMMFNKNTNGSPHVHVREASRSKGDFNSIGGIQGELISFDNGSVGEQYRDTKKGSYEVLITSLNPLDTILMAEVIYTLMYGAYETFQNEFETFDFSLKELVFQNSTAAQLYVKAITITGQQENIIPSIITNTILDKINFLTTNINNTPIINK